MSDSSSLERHTCTTCGRVWFGLQPPLDGHSPDNETRGWCPGQEFTLERFVAVDMLLRDEAVEHGAMRIDMLGGDGEAGWRALSENDKDDLRLDARAAIEAAIEIASTGEQHVAYTEPIQGRYGVGCETCGWKGAETYAHIEDARAEGRAHKASSRTEASQ